MNALYIANLDLGDTEGIYKKVCAQSDAVGNAVGMCKLITRRGKNAVVKCQGDSISKVTNCGFFAYINKCIEDQQIDLLYIRHMIPTIMLIKLLKTAKRKNIKLYYEVPTYPYFAEQFRTSRRKHRAIVKITLDVIFWPLIYRYIDTLVVIRSNTASKKYSKMVEITNGVRTDNIKSKDYSLLPSDNVFRMVTVGTLYPYHGYDRVLKALSKCGEVVPGKIVEFHVIGSSQTIDDLHKMANNLGLKHVIFHGTKTTEELNEMFDMFNVGLGCLALHRRNADIDTTLKVIEYYCRGIPVVTSGISPIEKYNQRVTIKVSNDEDSISIEDIYRQYINIDKQEMETLSNTAKQVFDWNNIISSVMGENS